MSNGILLSHKKEWNLAICNNVHLEGIILSEVSLRRKNTIWLYTGNLKTKQMNKANKTDTVIDKQMAP